MSEALARGLIRLLVTVGILAAVYFFMVKPIMDTTNDTIDRAFDGSDGIIQQIEKQIDASGVEDLDINLDTAEQAQRLLKCIQRANQDVDRIQRCNRRYAP